MILQKMNVVIEDSNCTPLNMWKC